MADCKRKSTWPDFTADEVEVAGILLSLHKKSESPKKRFSIDGPDSDLPTPGKVASTSPNSPMAFPSSIESDLKPLRQKNKVAMGLKLELLKESERLTDLQEQLQREVKKVEAYRDKLMVENTMLQQRRQQVKKASALPFTQSQPLIALAPEHQQQLPLILFPYQQMGPSAIIDLNDSSKKNTVVRLEYSQASDLQYHYRIWMAAMAKNKATAALARRNRSLILKAKNSTKMKSKK